MMDQKKRKYTVDKNVFLFTNDWTAQKCCALYEFKISVTKWGDGKYVIDSFYNEGDTLTPIETFFDQRSLPEINSVAACVLGPNLLYLIPHDEDSVSPSDVDSCYHYMSDEDKKLLMEERGPLAPCLFDLSKKKIVTNLRIESPLLARKIQPILISIGNKVFALSSPCPYVRCPEPCFESLDVVTNDDRYNNRWTPLDCPGFHSSIESFDLLVSGFAVLEEEGLILVSILDNKSTPSYFSYNIHSEKWSPVGIDQVEINDDCFRLPSYLHDKSAVVNNNIYTYYSKYMMLLVLPYTIAGGCDLSIKSASEVQGFKFQEKHLDNWDYNFRSSGTVTKVDDQILCVIFNICPWDYIVQELGITFIQVVGDGKECTTLKSFTCSLSNGTEFNHQAINSCFVLDDLEGFSKQQMTYTLGSQRSIPTLALPHPRRVSCIKEQKMKTKGNRKINTLFRKTRPLLPKPRNKLVSHSNKYIKWNDLESKSDHGSVKRPGMPRDADDKAFGGDEPMGDKGDGCTISRCHVMS